VRENTECLLSGKESIDEASGRATAERVITRTASERVARTAFQQAKARYAQAQDAAEHQSKFAGSSALNLRWCSLLCFAPL
jgi:isocitrate/isopropylmalate dehydrogenase